MRKSFPVEDLARDDRFVRVPMVERFNDPRTAREETDPRASAPGPAASPPSGPTRPTRPAA